MKNLIALFVSILALASCTKSDNGESSKRITNSTNEALNVAVYKSSQDYYSQKTPIFKTILDPLQSYPFAMQEGVSYCIDYYSDDYGITNWDDKKFFFNASNLSGDEYKIMDVYQNRLRQIFLQDKTETLWRAVAVYDKISYFPIWDILPNYEKNLSLTFTKDFKCAFIHYDGNMNPVIDTLYAFYDKSPLGPYRYSCHLKKDNNEFASDFMVAESNFAPRTNGHESPQSDTLKVDIGGHYYALIKF